MEAIIRTEKLNRIFKAGHNDFYALKNIDLFVNPGTLTILKGRSGSGKTTLLNLLGALDSPSSGKIYFNSRELTAMSESKLGEIRRISMGFVFQSIALISIMTAFENVDLGLRIAKYDAATRKDRAKECLSFVGLGKRMEHRTNELSGGEQQRVAIARAIAHKPQVIFADEPTAELDTHMGLQIIKVFRELVEKEGVTVVMTTHDPNMLELADKVYELQDGEIVDNIMAGAI